MGRPAIPPADRLILSLVKYGGSAPLTKIRANFYGRLTRVMLNKVLLELDDLIEVEKTHDAGSRRPVTCLVLTWKGEVAARVLKPSFRRKRITLAELKAELAARQAEQNPWACQIQKDADHRREFERQKAAGWTWRPSKPAKVAAPSPEISAPKASVPDVFKERHDYHPDSRNNTVVPSATPARPLPADDFARELARIQGSQLAGIGEPTRGFDNSPKSEPRASTGETRSEVYARAGDYRDSQLGLMFNGEVFGNDWKGWAVASKK
jgi:hypothetical protein